MDLAHQIVLCQLLIFWKKNMVLLLATYALFMLIPMAKIFLMGIMKIFTDLELFIVL